MNYEISVLMSLKMYRKKVLYINVYPRVISLKIPPLPFFHSIFRVHRLSFRRALLVVVALYAG